MLTDTLLVSSFNQLEHVAKHQSLATNENPRIMVIMIIIKSFSISFFTSSVMGSFMQTQFSTKTV